MSRQTFNGRLGENEMPRKCGASHPRYEAITCEKWGQCIGPYHRGITTRRDGRHAWIEWENINYVRLHGSGVNPRRSPTNATEQTK